MLFVLPICCHGDEFSVNTVDHGLMGDWELGGYGTVGRLSTGCERAGKWWVLEGRDGGSGKLRWSYSTVCDIFMCVSWIISVQTHQGFT